MGSLFYKTQNLLILPNQIEMDTHVPFRTPSIQQ